jgi:hypothetical protein
MAFRLVRRIAATSSTVSSIGATDSIAAIAFSYCLRVAYEFALDSLDSRFQVGNEGPPCGSLLFPPHRHPAFVRTEAVAPPTSDRLATPAAGLVV